MRARTRSIVRHREIAYAPGPFAALSRDDIASGNPKATMTSKEHRKAKRHPFHWQVAIVFDATEGKDTYHGITHDLSLLGCAILTEHNVFSEHPVSVLLQLPVESPGGRRRVVEVKARMIYTVLSSGHQRFRCGMQFIKFKGTGRATLERAIEKRAISSV